MHPNDHIEKFYIGHFQVHMSFNEHCKCHYLNHNEESTFQVLKIEQIKCWLAWRDTSLPFSDFPTFAFCLVMGKRTIWVNTSLRLE